MNCFAMWWITTKMPDKPPIDWEMLDLIKKAKNPVEDEPIKTELPSKCDIPGQRVLDWDDFAGVV